MAGGDVYKMIANVKGMAVIAALGALLYMGTAHRAYAQQAQAAAQAQAGPAQPQKKVKDQGEYDLYNNVVKETDPAKKLQYLNQWVEKYPETDFQEEQLQFYNQLNQPAKVLELGNKILAKDPKNLTALTLITANIQKIQNPSQQQLADTQKAAQTLLDNLDSLKPATVTDDAWKQAKPGVQNLAKGTIQWIITKPATDALEKKDYPAAEQAFTKLVQQFPDNGQYAYQLGSILISERNPDKFPQAIYLIARAVAMDPAKGGLPDANRKQVDTYLNRIYTQYHGADDAGLQQLKQTALNAPLPPADFKLKTAAEIASEKEEEFRTKNPQLALWMGIKKQLTDTNGDQYFDGTLKNAAVPKMKGTLVEAKPACRPKELLVAISDATHAEVKLKLDMALKGKPMTGTEFQWEGVPSGFTKDPFELTMDTESDKIEGLMSEACAAPATKKGVAKKKQQ
jgi:TolA-binding protein